jgi:hypothetical protein
MSDYIVSKVIQAGSYRVYTPAYVIWINLPTIFYKHRVSIDPFVPLTSEYYFHHRLSYLVRLMSTIVIPNYKHETIVYNITHSI